ncbi:Smoothened [Orchesella cincta]|uniref:Smoothened n=1 Tax=Orchesella cincta TaxID=48709 RepID=A0A1D2N8C9_ORCCI|nr:Smoothened [Orchesella cincta]
MGVHILLLSLLTLSVTESVRNNGPSGAFGESPMDNCRRKASKPCQAMQFSTCFGAKLPYAFTSSDLVNENFTQQQIQHEMKLWEGLRSVPRCWAVIQPLLCSVYMPKCQDDYIELPPQELCRITKNPCRVIEQAMKEWPSILKCEDNFKFPSGCKMSTDISELRFNKSGSCMEPMKEVESNFNYYEGFEGCALNCSNPLYSKEEHETVSRLIKYLGILTLCANGFVLATFMIDWKSAKVYPSVILFWVNLWYFFATIGWMVQFLPNTKEDIVCRKDTTIRRNEPDSGENIFCPMIFFMIYFGSMSALSWLSVFAYVWFLTCNAVGRIRERIDKKKLYFNVFAFLFPLVLTIICFSVGKVDGSSIAGICFVGINDSSARIALLIAPIGIACGLMMFYFWRGIYRLLSVSLSSSDFISEKGRAEIKSNATRVAIFSLALLGIVISSLVFQFKLMSAKPVWEKSLKDYFFCQLKLLDVAECELTEKADVSLVVGNVVVFFLGGLLMSSWAWTSASLRTWTRYVKRRCDSDESDAAQPHMQKHRLISQAFSKRHQLPAKGRLSLSLQSTHDDPMGFNKLLDPTHLCKNGDMEQSQQLNHTGTDADDINSEWAAALPHLLSRRGALVPPHSSNSVSCVSEDSRRPSCDSNMSELAARNLQSSGSIYDRSVYKKSRRDHWFRMSKRSRSGKVWNYPWRRGNGGSSSSLESNGGSQILPAITALIDKKLKFNGEEPHGTQVQNNLQPALKSPSKIYMMNGETQTSFEKLPTFPEAGKQKFSNTLSVDKATQSSLVSLHEIGTQTKKSATKKKEKDKKDKSKKDGKDTDCQTDKNLSEEDPVLKLLSPI